MGTSQMLGEDIDSWETMMFLYNSALKEVGTKLEILNDEFVHIHKYNPIEYIKSRIKTPESIVKKLKRDGYESTIENMRNYINDIAGIRIVCSFTSDIYRLAEMIGKQNDLTVICVKDYIKNPKVSGYKSFHMHVTVPIFLSDRVVNTKVEIQIRTIAMDFWASLEHKIYYKFEGHAPEYISRDLARQSVILKCNMQKSVMLGNYEFFYAAGLMRKLYNIEIRTDMEPEQILEAILQMQDNLAPQSEQEKYLIQIIKNYEPSADHDAQMDELFAWGEQEPDMWQVTTAFHPVIR